ncbi:MAG: 50S ribosomal protein L18, partial [Candidatus Methylomirabilis sp.]|nr:50S ribosomal protein L18 [Deltaproteobacteria bacterium]
MATGVKKIEGRARRQLRVRQKVRGTPERPRLCVFRSGKHIYAQLIDDVGGVTLAAASSVKAGKGSTKDAAKQVGAAAAEAAKSKGVTKVVFDRN